MAWPPSVADLCTYGLASSTLAPESRQLVSANPAGSVFELRAHAYAGGESVRIVPASTLSVLPTGLNYSTRYTVLPPSDPDFFQLDGVTITDAGTGVLTLLRDLTAPALALIMDRVSYVEAHFKAYRPPWTVPPGWAVGVVCRLAAYDFSTIYRVVSPQYSPTDLAKRAEEAEKFCAKGDTGTPYTDAQGPIDATPKVADMGPVAFKLKGRGFVSHHDREDLV